MYIRQNWKQLNAEVSTLTDRTIDIVAVTKTRNNEEIRAIILAGAEQLGENRVEETQRKFFELGLKNEFPQIILHMIGHLQSRQSNLACQIFDWIDSIDSLKLVNSVNKHCQKLNKVMNILVQVNVSGESQKYGIKPDQTNDFVSAILSLPAVKLQGLMAMAPFTDDQKVISDTFYKLNQIKKELSQKFGPEYFKTLSMGMSNDYLSAIKNGSSMLRIGSRLFKKI